MLNTLNKIEVKAYIERLAEHALACHLKDGEVAMAFQKRYLEIAMDIEGHNQCAVARRLRIHRNTLARRLIVFGIRVRRQKKAA